MDAYCRERHLLVAPGGDLTGHIDRELMRRKKERVVVAGTSSFMTTGWITAHSDCVLTAPSRMVRQFETYLPLKTFAPPVPIPYIKIVQVWHERNHQDPAHQ
jgi:DNA-binding transcriptional LysR family regulator